MKLIDVVRLSAGNLKRNRQRSILTISGVAIGISTIIFLVSLGFGLQMLSIQKLTQLEALTTVTVTPGNAASAKLTPENVDKFKQIKGVDQVSSTHSVPSYISLDGKTTDSTAYILDTKTQAVENIRVKEGKTFSENAKDEAILSKSILNVFDVKDEKSVIGKKIDANYIFSEEEINKEKLDPKATKGSFTIIGIADDERGNLYIPSSSMSGVSFKYFYQSKVKVKDRADVGTVRQEIDTLGFNTTSVEDKVSEIETIFLIVKITLGAFGLIALLVASIGIFNTMTIALLERTHEIGVMKAIGGTDKDIKRTFIFEVSIIGLLGGFIGVISGVLFGWVVNWVINRLAIAVGGEPNTLFYTPLIYMVLAVVGSFLISTAAGIYPAKRASKLNPIEALRYE
ncbi:ABC transporter permease [bacterium]|nr:ABC transporter permease [bacterium]